MNETGFRCWLQQQGYNKGTINSRVSNCVRVCNAEGDLDVHYSADKCKALLEKLNYTITNQREGAKPKHNIKIRGNVLSGTATLRQAVNLYISFLKSFDKSDFNYKNRITEKVKERINEAEEPLIPESVIDSYAGFLEYFDLDKNQFYNFGIDTTIFATPEEAYFQWEQLKKRLLENQPLTIRSYGRQGKHTELFTKLYVYLFANTNINEDKTNNAVPRKNIQTATGHRINITLLNYQCSHIFGHTKNPLLFEAVWNICFTPKMFDPLTGHEAKGPWPEEYQHLLFFKSMNLFGKCIADYNNFVESNNISERITQFVKTLKNIYDDDLLEKFQADALSEWQKISIDC